MTTLTKRRKAGVAIGLVLLAGGCIAYGLWGMRERYAATHSSTSVIPAGAVTRSTGTPDETPPTDACETHKAPFAEPRKIELPSLGVSGCVQKVGLDQHAAISAPTNIHLAGWYIHSVPPGEAGVSLIDGHVQGRYSEGIFKKLDRLRTGHKIKVQLGSGQWREFEVVRTALYTVDAASQEMLKPIEGIDRQLTLITCGGAYNKQTKTYDKRVIVQAKLL